MEQLKGYYDRTGNTLTVWFGDPSDEYICEEAGDEVILMKDRNQQVIGFEKLHFLKSQDPAWFADKMEISIETVEQ